jgi:ornithine cyclodeaminase/alanine dehydrogenase-like protein (mu-crystallin family)
MPLWLSEQDVRAALSMRELIQAMESALIAFSSGQVVQPVRMTLELRERAFFALMPAYDKEHALFGAKLVTVIPENHGARGATGSTVTAFPSHQAIISLSDPATGELLALMDGRYITEARTAAASAVSVRHLARKDAAVLAIIGSGVQAHSHAQALPLVQAFGEIRAWSPSPAHLQQFAASANTSPVVHAAGSAEEAVRGADVVVLATASVTPVIEDSWVAAGTHVIGVGACRPDQREIDPELVARSYLVVDSRAAALQESGDVLLAMREGRFGEDHIGAELGEVAGGVKRGRIKAEEITVFKSLGLAIEDVVSAGLVYRSARKTGRGTQISL